MIAATDAAPDGVRKIAQALRRRVGSATDAYPVIAVLESSELGLALGGTNVIHAAVLAGGAGRSALKRVVALDRFRGGFPEENLEIAAVADVIGAADSAAAEDVE